MPKNNKFTKYLPLSESTFYIMLSLVEPMHGYGIMQNVENISGGQVKIGPGTLYGAFTSLENEKLIVKVTEIDRRKLYQLTKKGETVLRKQMERYEVMLNNGRQFITSSS